MIPMHASKTPSKRGHLNGLFNTSTASKAVLRGSAVFTMNVSAGAPKTSDCTVKNCPYQYAAPAKSQKLLPLSRSADRSSKADVPERQKNPAMQMAELMSCGTKVSQK